MIVQSVMCASLAGRKPNDNTWKKLARHKGKLNCLGSLDCFDCAIAQRPLTTISDEGGGG